MGFSDLLKSFFGNKSQRDIKKILPIVDKIKQVSPGLVNESIDQLRDRITAVRARLPDADEPQRDRFAELKKEIEALE